MSEMNARERMLAAMSLEPVDRVPTDIWAVAEIWQKLRDRFGEDANLREALHIDGMGATWAEYIGPPLPEVPEGELVNFWGIQYRPVPYDTGVYHEQSVWPLKDTKTIDDLVKHEWPSADWFDYSKMRDIALAARETQVVACGYMAIFYTHLLLRGLEQALIDPHDDPEYTDYLLNRVSDFLYECHRRMFEACDGLIDVAQVTDDFGSQTGPLISLDTFRIFYRPHMERFIGLCREHNIKVLHHDDGAIRPFLPDLVEMGIDILNPVQSACPGMEMNGLKRDFGDKLCFHGGLDNQGVLPFGTPDDVRAAVREAVDALASDGTGYILAPCHNIQALTPLENIIAMYDEAWRYGAVGVRAGSGQAP